jgi:hypothetical protein
VAFDSIFPFLPGGAGSPPQVFPYDVIINTAFPGIEFIGTEPNAEYQEIREVNGCLWIVTNAMYNENLLQWDQEVNQNTTLSAYALELCGDGSMTRYESPPTLIPMTPITWTPLWTMTGTGLIDSTPLEVTGPSVPMENIAVTWDPGIGVVLTARQVDVTNIASSPNSLLDNLRVNGTNVWSVNEEGVLVAGTVPAALIVGNFVNANFTGTSTFNGPVVMNDGLTVTAGATILEGTLTSTIGSTLEGGTTVTGGEAVTGGLTTDTLVVSGTSTFNGLATFNDEITTDSITVTGAAVFNGSVMFADGSDVGIFSSGTFNGVLAGTFIVSLVMPLSGGSYNYTLSLSVSFDIAGTITFSDTGHGAWLYMNSTTKTSVYAVPGGGGGVTVAISGSAGSGTTASVSVTYSQVSSVSQPDTAYLITAQPTG